MAGSLEGVERLNRYLSDVERKLTHAPVLTVGFLENAEPYENGMNVATVAMLNEFGTSRIPPRPFFRTMIANHQKEWGPEAAFLLRATDYDMTKAANLLGERIAGELVESINEWFEPPNAPSTIARKGFDKPLIETGLMRRMVDFNVDDGGTAGGGTIASGGGGSGGGGDRGSMSSKELAKSNRAYDRAKSRDPDKRSKAQKNLLRSYGLDVD